MSNINVVIKCFRKIKNGMELSYNEERQLHQGCVHLSNVDHMKLHRVICKRIGYTHQNSLVSIRIIQSRLGHFI